MEPAKGQRVADGPGNDPYRIVHKPAFALLDPKLFRLKALSGPPPAQCGRSTSCRRASPRRHGVRKRKRPPRGEAILHDRWAQGTSKDQAPSCLEPVGWRRVTGGPENDPHRGIHAPRVCALDFPACHKALSGQALAQRGGHTACKQAPPCRHAAHKRKRPRAAGPFLTIRGRRAPRRIRLRRKRRLRCGRGLLRHGLPDRDRRTRSRPAGRCRRGGTQP